jgi:hypothetical protein
MQRIEMQTSWFLTAVMSGNICYGWLGSVSIVKVDISNLPQNEGNIISDTLDFAFLLGDPTRTMCSYKQSTIDKSDNFYCGSGNVSAYTANSKKVVLCKL